MDVYDPFYAPLALRETGFDDLVAVLKPHLAPFEARLDSAHADFSWCTDIAAAKQLTAFRVKYSADWSATPLTHEKHLFVIFLLEGALRITFDGKREVTALPGTALLYGAGWNPQQLQMRARDSFACFALKIDREIVAKTLSSLVGKRSLSDFPFQPLVDLSTPSGQFLTHLVKSIAFGMHRSQVQEQPSNLLALLGEGVVRLVFDHILGDTGGSKCAQLAAPPHIKAAVKYMHAHLHQPLSVAEIAGACGVSVRSLQIGFRQFCQASPLEYLRRLRLEAVHRELALPENRLPVAEVASKWGFVHLGRFSSDYLAAYGMRPSDTVKRAREL